MKCFFKILFSLFVFGSAVCYYVIGIAIGSSSHRISVDDRNGSVLNAEIAVVVCFGILVILWLPWGGILKKKG
jgi:hypothetical protein